MSRNWGPSCALTKAQHDAYLAARNGRPVTQDPMREARPVDIDPAASSLVDEYLNNAERGTAT